MFTLIYRFYCCIRIYYVYLSLIMHFRTFLRSMRLYLTLYYLNQFYTLFQPFSCSRHLCAYFSLFVWSRLMRRSSVEILKQSLISFWIFNSERLICELSDRNHSILIISFNEHSRVLPDESSFPCKLNLCWVSFFSALS